MIKYLASVAAAVVPALAWCGTVYMPPSEDVVFEFAEVYLHFDSTHNANAHLSKRDSVFQYIEQRDVDVQTDLLGRFAVWRMVPSEVMMPETVKGRKGRIDIYVENAPISSLSDTITTDSGDVMLPYSIWCRAELADPDGKSMYSTDYGLIKGFKSQSQFSDGEITQSTNILGINEAMGIVRSDIMGKYGFSVSSDPADKAKAAGSKYSTMLNILNGNMAQFVDYYAYNDLLCQIYEFNAPFSFLRPDTVDRSLKAVDATIYRNGNIHGTYTLEYKNGRLKSFSGYLYSKDSDGKPVKQKINTITPRYNKKTGEYDHITTFDGQLAKVVFPGYESTTEWGQKSKQPNYCKTQNLIGGFLKMKEETTETVEMSVDLEGNVYFDCESNSSIPYSLFKMVADSNSVKFPMLTSENHTTSRTRLKYDDKMNIVERDLEGTILLEKNRGYNNYTYIKADSIKSRTEFVYDGGIFPKTVKRNASVVVLDNWDIDYKWDLKSFLGKHNNTKVRVNKESEDVKNSSLSVDFSVEWAVKVSHDADGEISSIKMGNTEVKFSYRR